ncbi:BLUF domain-containing protein [uncultured Winogradskyella sp.]|uniref:BLUF domain-containing protein n=1 Tax=uncultured Winogradskyella sp. TaxID=395353 RepID=UPI002617F686|nr:BLUF domain-containing protein [uncultured Winogradskyella sp.]
MKAICYISDFSSDLTDQSTDDLISFVNTYNNSNNVTGLLILKNKHFFQILEGEHDIIDALFKRIQKDMRHTNVIKLLDTKIKGRVFDDYNGGNFKVFENTADMNKLYLYFNWIKQAEYLPANSLIQLTTNFLNQNK